MSNLDFPFLCYTGSFELAARELARTRAADNNPILQAQICKKYGIFLDNITDDEVTILCKMVEEYASNQLQRTYSQSPNT